MKQLLYITLAVGTLSALPTTTHAALKGGDVDTTFDPGSLVSATVNTLAVQPDGKVIVGGDFGLERLNVDGSLDMTFQPEVIGPRVNSVALQSDGKIILGGAFAYVDGTGRQGIARVNGDGSLDPSFQNGMSGADGEVHSIVIQQDGQILVGGEFPSFNGAPRNDIVRLNNDGGLDTNFQNVYFDLLAGNDVGLVSSIVRQADGKIVIGGSFDTVNGVVRSGIARLDSNGSLDSGFQSGMLGLDSIGSGGSRHDTYALAVQPDGKILVAGDFTRVNGTTRTNLARLNDDGSLDLSFQNEGIRLSGSIYSIGLETDGKVYIAGFYSSERHGVARLNPDGSLDDGFQNNVAGGGFSQVFTLVLQASNKLLIGGDFSTVNGLTRPNLARLYRTAPLFLSDSRVVANQFHFSISGESNQIAVIEASTDLLNWIAIMTNRLNASSVSLTDPDPATFSHRFYRARVQ
jgi:uncharacterized delta-60 repeat protein